MIQEKAITPQCVSQSNAWDPDSLSIPIASQAQLANSENRIELALDPNSSPPNAVTNFEPPQHSRLRDLPSFSSITRKTLHDAHIDDPFIALADFEIMVGRGALDEWLRTRLDESRGQEEATRKLWQLLQKYHSIASGQYARNPEDLSMMVLTELDLWVAIDKLACKAVPEMKEYPPEVPSEANSLLKHLLFRKAVDFERARKVADYIRQRKNNAAHQISVFSDHMDAFAFPVKYYNNSAEMQNLRDQIEANAGAAQEAALEVWREQTRKYNDLKTRILAMGHAPHTEDNEVWEGGGRRRKRRRRYVCNACDLEREAESIYCQSYEWPLPAEEIEIKRVVFELKVPKFFGIWRAATSLILLDLATPPDRLSEFDKRKPHTVLPTSSKLGEYCSPADDDNVMTIASPAGVHHNSNVKIPASREEICVSSPYSWKGFDPRTSTWTTQPANTERGTTGNLFREANTKRYGTLHLPELDSSWYTRAKLNYAVASTEHTSNQVLANQIDCPPEMSLHEYIAFGTMRSGGRTQWMNLLREMRAAGTSLSWGRTEVSTLVSMVIWQIGVIKPDHFDWHLDLNEMSFGKALLEEATGMLRRVEGNWKEVTTVRTLILITLRLLSSSPHNEVIQECIAFLRDVRRVTWGWLGELQEKLKTIPEEFLKSFQERVCEMAAVCRSTYDVDDVDAMGAGNGHLPSVLSTPEDIKVLVCCGILIHDNTPHDLNAAKSSVPADFRRLLHRDRRLAHAVEYTLRDLIRTPAGGPGIDQGITQIWTAYAPGQHGWDVVQRWASCNTSQRQAVHLDLLKGSLLVNGRPLGRLPNEIVTHADYLRLFGDQKVLDVIPAEQRGMSFATRSIFCGHQVLFGMREQDVVIRAIRDDKTYELIPHTHFRGDLPVRFVEECVHWLELSTGDIEIRPLQSLWESSPDNWIIHFSGEDRICTSRNRILIDINSESFRMISATMAPFESSDYVIATCRDFDPDTLEVELPRYRLSFFRNSANDLESKNFPGMVIDHLDQSIGALVGLQTRLVLKPRDPTAAGLRRRVLVPYGSIEVPAYLDDHVEVIIQTKDAQICRFADYIVDDDQGCLTGTTSLKSRLYLIYLLALTSHCLPDPLTKHTGTEEALIKFYEAACMSFRDLSLEETELLLHIGKLTPVRTGSHKQQAITWSTLPTLSQHDTFTRRAKEIITFAEHQRVFADEEKSPKESEKQKQKKNGLAKRNTFLDARATARISIYYPDSFPINPCIGNVSDHPYHSRHQSLEQERGREKIIASAAKGISLGGSHILLPQPSSLPELLLEWKRVRNINDRFSLSYGRQWLAIDMPSAWLSIYSQCISREAGKEKKKYQLAFSLSVMVFAKPELACYVPMVTLCFNRLDLVSFTPPSALTGTFDLAYGRRPSADQIRHRITKCQNPIERTPSWNLERLDDEEDAPYRQRRTRHHRDQVDRLQPILTDHFISCWQSYLQGNTTLRFPPNVQRLYFLPEALTSEVERLFRICNENRLLHSHANQVNNVLEQGFDAAVEHHVGEYCFEVDADSPTATKLDISLTSLLAARPPPEIAQRGSDLWGDADAFRISGTSTESDKLRQLLSVISETDLPLRKRYAQDLQDSIANISAIPSPPSAPSIPFTVEDLLAHKQSSREQLEETLHSIVAALSPASPVDEAVAASGIWPRLALRDILRHLAFPINQSLTVQWKSVLLLLSRDVVEYQRAIRLVAYRQQEKKEDFFRELDTNTFDMENASNYPDWPLIQIEGNFLARPLQVRVAQEMITPSSNANTVLQLNMGEGKSSVIVPLVASALADGAKLVRVVILKPLAGQMFQLLVERLAGLANRRIFFMPFSRNLRVGADEASLIQQSYDACMQAGGVWIVQPEHILSFKLMGVDRSIVSNTAEEDPVAEALTASQRWLDNHSRDILDESDEILHIRYQLVYTVGHQEALELHPHRWTVVEELYTLASRHIQSVKERHRNGVDLQAGPSGSFLSVRIIDDRAGDDLISAVVDDIFKGRLPSLSVRWFTEAIQCIARRFISERKVQEEEVQQLLQYLNAPSPTWKRFLLLRGLIAHGILLYSLKQRQFRVDYGLDLSRSLLAVPYRAKDVPSIRAEFGHPDVALTLTCLSYYYQGLNDSQLRLCFDLLYKLDNPRLVYETWVHNDSTIPIHLQTLNGLNIEDGDQHKNLVFPLFSKRKTVIDFYLSHFVFPKAAKSFPHKLSTSGWDLAETKPGHVTTGFSGTNDNRFLLPTSISQQDPLQQSGTNAKVLTYLLQDENNHYRAAALPDNGRLPVRQFLEFMIQETQENPVQVLLDVGAQMLDLKNEDLAREWLRLRDDMSATVFFDDHDEMTVVTKDGIKEPLLSSPFKAQLEQCLVYLDDAHTRGTDLKLPPHSRAAVTLGPKVTKDRLIQGCMRMRKLGFGQSLIFFAPAEIDRAIRAGRPPLPDGGMVPFEIPVQTEDILRWAIYETCQDIMHHLPHWAEQGWDYQRRREAWDNYTAEVIAAEESEDEEIAPNIDILNSIWVRDEALSLERMYGVKLSTGIGGGDADMREAIFAIPVLRDTLIAFGANAIDDTDLDEEQEREVSHEIEKETEIERPRRVDPAKHHVSPLVDQFVKTGILPHGGEGHDFRKAFMNMFDSLTRSVKHLPDREIWHRRLFVTTDFALTISKKDDIERSRAEYLRPVNWLVTSSEDPTVVVALSPFEVNHLLPAIRQHQNVSLHVYTPRVTRDMRPLDDLRFYIVPQISDQADVWVPPPLNVMSQLNIYAGQLYIGSYELYLQLGRFLGIHTTDEKPMDDYSLEADGFVRPRTQFWTDMGLTDCRFNESPIQFLQDLLGLRRKGAGYSPTHMGKLVNGGVLTVEDFGGQQ